MKRGHPVRIWSHLVSDLWRVRDTCGPTPENSWVSQQQGGRTGLLISHLSRFQYFQGRAVDLEKGQVSSPKSSRLSSQLLGWDVLKKDSEKYMSWGLQTSCDKTALDSLKERCWPRVSFHRALASHWPNFLLDHVQGQETQFFLLCGSPLELLELGSSSCARVKTYPQVLSRNCQSRQKQV